MSWNFFIDDFELALKNNFEKNIDLDASNLNVDSLINLYISSSFKIEDIKSNYDYAFLGKETDRDYVWLYIEVENFKPKDTITFENRMLMELFDDQTNQINFEYNSTIKTYTLNKTNSSIQIDL